MFPYYDDRTSLNSCWWIEVLLKTPVLQRYTCEMVARKPVVSPQSSCRLALADSQLDHVQPTYKPSVSPSLVIHVCIKRDADAEASTDII